MPRNAAAVQQANTRLWVEHPELGGRQLTSGPADAELRREWMSYYVEATAGATAPVAVATPLPVSSPPLPAQPASAVEPCDRICTDDSQRECPCKELTTITLYVQKRDSPVAVVGSYLWGTLSKTTPRPDTGHTFIGIGDGSLSSQRAYGFYPARSWLGGTGGINTNTGFYLPGEAQPSQTMYDPENEHPFSHSTSFKACPGAVATLETAIQKEIADIQADAPGALKYNLAGLQCTTWARQHLRALGFDDPGGFSPYGAARSIENKQTTAVGESSVSPKPP